MVVCERGETLRRSVLFYFQQRSFGRVYVFPVSACRKSFMLIVSERERMKLGLPLKSAVSVLGGEPQDEEDWVLAKKYTRLKTACEEVIRRHKHAKNL